MGLTQEQRYQIYAFVRAGFLQKDIASEIGVHKSTISRELQRNRGLRGYRPKQAHATAMNRRMNVQKYVKLTPKVIALINDMVRQDMSSAQVSGRLKLQYEIGISHDDHISVYP